MRRQSPPIVGWELTHEGARARRLHEQQRPRRQIEPGALAAGQRDARVRRTRLTKRRRTRRAWAGWRGCLRRTRRTTGRSRSACPVSTWSDAPSRTREMVRATVTPALCIVAQGAKIVMLGREVYSYDASRMIAYAVDLPVAGQIVRASQREPFLALKLDLDPYKIAELALKVYPHGVPSTRDSRGLIVGQATTAIVDAAARLVELMAEPADARVARPARRRRDPHSPPARCDRPACRADWPAGVGRPARRQGGDVGARALRAADGASRRWPTWPT